MTELIENHQSTVPPAPVDRRPNPLYRALAWVGIAACSLFIVATVFFSGYLLGQHGNGGGHHGLPPMLLHKPFGGPDGSMGPPDGRMGPDGGPRGGQLPPPPPGS